MAHKIGVNIADNVHFISDCPYILTVTKVLHRRIYEEINGVSNQAYYQALKDNGISCTLITNEGGHYDYQLMAQRHLEVVFPYLDQVSNN